MANLRNRRNFSSPSLEAIQGQLPPPIPTGKGSRSAADASFSEYVDSTMKLEQVPELILPEHVIRCSENLVSAPEIDYLLLLKGDDDDDDDQVQRVLRSAEEFGVVRIIEHGLIFNEEVKSTLIENEWALEKLSKSSRQYADRDEFVWCPKIAEKAATIFGDKNLHIFCQAMNNVAEKVEEIGKELSSVLMMIAKGKSRRGFISRSNTTIQTSDESTTQQQQQQPQLLVVQRYHEITDDQLTIPSFPTPIKYNNGSGETIIIFSSTYYSFRFHLILPLSHASPQTKFKKEPLVLIQLQQSDNNNNKVKIISGFEFDDHHSNEDDNNNNSFRKRLTVPDQILILLLLLIMYMAFFPSNCQ